MDAKSLQTEQQNIHQKIREVYENLVDRKVYNKEVLEPINDGVTKFEEYLSERPRIMWILKEPWDEIRNGKPYGGGFSIPEIQQDKNFINNISYAQKRIIYTMQCIRTRGEEKYDNMNWYWKMPQHLQNIAYINLSKMPGYSTTDNAFIECAKPWAEIVKKQISIYDPDVIILGNIYDVALQLKIIENAEFKESIDGLVDVYLTKENKLLLNAYHPSYYAINIRKYSESLTKTICKYYK